jgi:23S rRNA (adenine2503-C2)-methyltransferase
MMTQAGITRLLPLLGLTLGELQTIIRRFGMPEYTARQIAAWLYVKKVTYIDEMTDLSLSYRTFLKEKYEVGKSTPVEHVCSRDGTIKYLYKTGNSLFVESVYIPDNERATLCVSSQAGCRMNCKFCMTGRQGFSANLSAYELLNQIHSSPERNKLTNIVLMGMGEPLDNLDEVLKVLEILTSSYGYGWSSRRITLSTVGLRNGLKRFIEESDCHLAISLHSPLPLQRAGLIPAERAYSITEITELLREYNFKGQRRLSFEYILFKGLNDSLVHAKELVRLLRGLNCRVNLIRFHSTPAIIEFEGSDSETILKFRDYLTSHGVFSMIRISRGKDVFAACGMLSTAKRERSKG